MTGSFASAENRGVHAFRKRQSSLVLIGCNQRCESCGQAGPYWFAGRIPAHDAGGCGGRQRRFPTGAAAYGIPKKAAPWEAESNGTPWSTPELIVTAGEGFVAGHRATSGMASRISKEVVASHRS